MRKQSGFVAMILLSVCLVGCSGLRLEFKETVEPRAVVVPRPPVYYYTGPNYNSYEYQLREQRRREQVLWQEREQLRILREIWQREHHEWHRYNHHPEHGGRSWDHDRWHRHHPEP